MSKNHYVDNAALYDEYVKYAAIKKKALEEGKPVPQLTDPICKAILLIANKDCYSAKFVNYTSNWKEEMIGDAIEICVRYAHNFDPEKYDNPFGYLTQLIRNAYIARIIKEKRQLYYKYKLFDIAGGFEAVMDDNVKDTDIQAMTEMTDMYRDHLTFIHEYEKAAQEKRDEKRSNDDETEELEGLDLFLCDPEEIIT